MTGCVERQKRVGGGGRGMVRLLMRVLVVEKVSCPSSRKLPGTPSLDDAAASDKNKATNTWQHNEVVKYRCNKLI
jgi:hypothetical protein